MQQNEIRIRNRIKHCRKPALDIERSSLLKHTVAERALVPWFSYCRKQITQTGWEPVDRGSSLKYYSLCRFSCYETRGIELVTVPRQIISFRVIAEY